jgi:DNA polymerase
VPDLARYRLKIVFIGEAPGKNEALTGKPFCGAAGKVLDKLLATVGIERKNVYVTNIVKDRPPENRDPTPSEIALYSPFLIEQLEILKPQIIVTLGRFSMKFMLEQLDVPEKTETISALHGKLLTGKLAYGDVKVLALYHPAVALYNGNTYKTLEKDFQALKQFI